MAISNSSYYTPRCMDFKATFKDLPGVTTFEHEMITYDGKHTDFGGTAYINHLEFVSIIDIGGGEYMVYINNPGCPVDNDGNPVFSEEHPQQQWVFGYYTSFKRALNKALSIVQKRKYPKPIEIY